MFLALYVIHHIASAFFFCTVVAMLPLQSFPKRSRFYNILGWVAIIFSVITFLVGGLLYFTYTWQLFSFWAIGALLSWLAAIFLLAQSLSKRPFVPQLATKILLTPLAMTAAVLSLEQPPLLGTSEVIVYALVGGGIIFLWHYINVSRLHRKRLAKGAISILTISGILGIFLVHQHLSYLPGVMSMNMTSDQMQMNTISMKSVADLTAPKTATHVDHFNLVASAQTVKLSSGTTVDAWTFGGTSPGPTLRVTQGDLVEVVVTNHLNVPTTIHWHGIDLDNADDGVAGVTQNAILPGKTYTYRFIAKDAGTYWYHSHEAPADQIPKGLYGTVVIQPKHPKNERDEVIAIHTWKTNTGNRLTFNTADTLVRSSFSPGTKVRLRITNTDAHERWVQLLGTSFKVAALDGQDITNPTYLNADRIEVAAGGRVDITFTMPPSPVQIGAPDNPDGPAILFSADGTGSRIAAQPNAPIFDMMSYGTKIPGALTINSHFDKSYDINADQYIGFFDGQFGIVHDLNGKLLPYTKMLIVHEGDVVKLTFRNRTVVNHPMHLHGHHFTVLSHNGKPYTGSTVRLDTLQTKPGDTWVVGFVADNPGIWMSHCHNLNHAAQGMDLMIGYDNVTTPYTFGPATPNKPE